MARLSTIVLLNRVFQDNDENALFDHYTKTLGALEMIELAALPHEMTETQS